MEKIVKKFWEGQITLWKAYWLVGELMNALFIIVIFNIEIVIFKNNNLGNLLPFINFGDFNLVSKIALLFWTLFITVGIWKSAENYKGSFFFIMLTLIFLSYRLFGLRLIFF